MDVVDDILSHYGTKGMKWGVRKSAQNRARAERVAAGTASRRDKVKLANNLTVREAVKARGDLKTAAANRVAKIDSKQAAKNAKKVAKTAPQDVKIKETPGKKLKTEGGKNQPASEDAKRAAALNQKAKKSTVDSLDNKELKDLVTRMQLEQNYSNLTAQRKGFGRKFSEGVLKQVGTQQTSVLLNEQATKARKKVS